MDGLSHVEPEDPGNQKSNRTAGEEFNSKRAPSARQKDPSAA
jgi:hypothetical protein